MRSILSLGLLVAIALPASADPTKLNLDKPVKVPFTLMPTGHFLVLVKLNDKGPYKLIFDTGSPLMLINNKIGLDSGVLEKKASGGFSLFGPMTQAKAKSLEIGPLKAEQVNVMVMDHPTVKAFSKFFEKDHGSIDGIVGFPFFARYRMTIDYQTKELLFTPTDYKPTDVMEGMMKLLLGDQAERNKPKIAGAAGQWGLVVDKDAKDEEAGVTIKSVMAGSPAEKAGLKSGDRLLTIDGRWTDSIGDTYVAASYVKPGKTAPVVVKRDGKEVKLTVTPSNGF